ncbi:MAG TPA: TlpA disulfide reductase family protein [bacterium]
MKTDEARRWGGAGRAVAALLVVTVLAAPALAVAQDTYRPLVQGAAPPDFTLPDTAGRPVSLSDFRGRAVLLSFISCYADTCFEPVNAFEALFQRVGTARLAVLSVCMEVPEALARNGYAGLLKNCSAGQRVLVDRTGAAGRSFFVRETPTSILLGPDFTVQEVLQGVAPLRDPALPGRIEALAAQVGPPAPRP